MLLCVHMYVCMYVCIVICFAAIYLLSIYRVFILNIRQTVIVKGFFIMNLIISYSSLQVISAFDFTTSLI